MADGPKAPKGFLIAGVICLVLALGGCATGIVGVTTIAGVASDIATTTPFGERTSFTAANDTGALVLLTQEADCTGTDGSGNDISFEVPGGTFTAEANGESFNAAKTFDTVEGESYELSCGGESASTGSFTVLKLPAFPGGIAGLAGAILGGFLGGGLLFLLGVIFVIVGLVKRSGWKKRNGPGAPMMAAGGAVPPPPGGFVPPPGGAVPPPPGGYAPPQQGGTVPPPPSSTPPAYGAPSGPAPQAPPPAPPSAPPSAPPASPTPPPPPPPAPN